jgi:hypothetical protein
MRVALLLIVACLFSFLLGVVFGVGGYAWHEIGGIVPPADQETSRIEVSLGNLKPENQWLEKAHFQVVPLVGVKSPHDYFMILVTPPSGGVQVTLFSDVWLYLTSSGDSTVQPFELNKADFGPNGDQPALKFIEGGITAGRGDAQLKVSDGAP